MKIISDGTPENTKFYNDDGSEIIDKITHVKIDMDPKEIVAHVTYLNPKLELSNITEVK